jgi:hypothetical protein
MLAAALGAPAVKLLDARVAGLDEDELRAWARAETAVLPAPHTSRSYRYPYALVTWHSEPVGVDIERVEPLEETFMESICTPSERGLLDEAGSFPRSGRARRRWQRPSGTPCATTRDGSSHRCCGPMAKPVRGAPRRSRCLPATWAGCAGAAPPPRPRARLLCSIRARYTF